MKAFNAKDYAANPAPYRTPDGRTFYGNVFADIA